MHFSAERHHQCLAAHWNAGLQASIWTSLSCQQVVMNPHTVHCALNHGRDRNHRYEQFGVSDIYIKYDFLIKRFFIHNGQTWHDLPRSSGLYCLILNGFTGHNIFRFSVQWFGRAIEPFAQKLNPLCPCVRREGREFIDITWPYLLAQEGYENQAQPSSLEERLIQ